MKPSILALKASAVGASAAATAYIGAHYAAGLLYYLILGSILAAVSLAALALYGNPRHLLAGLGAGYALATVGEAFGSLAVAIALVCAAADKSAWSDK